MDELTDGGARDAIAAKNLFQRDSIRTLPLNNFNCEGGPCHHGPLQRFHHWYLL